MENNTIVYKHFLADIFTLGKPDTDIKHAELWFMPIIKNPWVVVDAYYSVDIISGGYAGKVAGSKIGQITAKAYVGSDYTLNKKSPHGYSSTVPNLLYPEPENLPRELFFPEIFKANDGVGVYNAQDVPRLFKEWREFFMIMNGGTPPEAADKPLMFWNNILYIKVAELIRK